MRIGFIGLGQIGLPLAKKLAADSGNEMVLFDARRDSAASAAAAIGAQVADNAREIAAKIDALIVSVSGPEAQEAVFLGQDGVFQGAPSGLLIVDLTTTSRMMNERLARESAARGIDYLDAPVSVAQRPDIAGTLTIMAGGEKHAFERAKPLLDRLAPRVHFVGPSGSGTALKLINQGIYIAFMLAFAEGLMKGEAEGIPFETLLDVLATSSAGNPSIETKYTELRGLSDNKFAAAHASNYLTWAQAIGSEDMRLPIFAAALQTIAHAVDQGAGAEDIIVARHKYLSRLDGC